jgi:hypothetical protein
MEIDPVLRETLDALDMPPEAVPGWLKLLERFYLRHGGERHYAECLALLAECERLLVENR